MDTSNELFYHLKYCTIHVSINFRLLNDRILPPIVDKLMNPLQQLHLSLDTEDCMGQYIGVCQVKTCWEHPTEWRSTDFVTVKDIKWFLSIPAQSLQWAGRAPFLIKHPIFIRALRKYERLTLYFNDYFYQKRVPFNGLNNCNNLKFLHISGYKDFKIPILPSLIKLKLVGDIGKIDLRNLVYSLSLKEVSVIDHRDKPIPIPKQLKERGVILDSSPYYSIFVEIDDEISNMKESDHDYDDNSDVNSDDDDDYDDDDYDDEDSDLDGSFNIYDEDEVTLYTEHEYYEDDQSDEDERGDEFDEEDEDQEDAIIIVKNNYNDLDNQ